ncbi:MAG: hypothetical protein FJ146_17080 [Deltaproteobacteria bacterium]|nr:hypothetical protein [Deltaproteobacteria bacterium]
MVQLTKFFIILGFVSITACGSKVAQNESGQSEVATASDSSSWSLTVSGAADLPTCTLDNEGRMAYVRSTSQFMACNAGSWNSLSIGPQNSLVKTADEQPGSNCTSGGISIKTGTDKNNNGSLDDGEEDATKFACNGTSAKGLMNNATIWRYENHEPGPDQMIGAISSVWECYLTNIQIVKFGDGGGFISMAGLYIAEVIGDSGDWYDEHWSFTSFLTAKEGSHLVKFKSQIIDDRIIAAGIELTDPPYFTATVFDGTSSISGVKRFYLTKMK